jgi:hypothetical protein
VIESAVCLDVNPSSPGYPATVGVVELDGLAMGAKFLLPVTADSWVWLESFVGSRPVIAYNASYDRAALSRLLDSFGIPTPAWDWFCALRPIREVLRPRPCDLQSIACDLGLYGPAEMDALRAAGRQQFSSKWLLQTAQDDAEACARLVLWLAAARGCTTLPEAFGTLAYLRPAVSSSASPQSR